MVAIRAWPYTQVWLWLEKVRQRAFARGGIAAFCAVATVERQAGRDGVALQCPA